MLLRDSAIYIVSRAIPGALGFVTAMLLTWLLPPASFGLYGLGMVLVMLANNVLFAWLAACLMRWHETHQDEPAFMPTILALFGGMSLAPTLLLAVASVSGLTRGHTAFAWIVLFGSVAYGWFELSSHVQIFRYRPMRYLYMTLLRNGLILTGGPLVAYLTQSAEVTLLVCFAAMAASGCLFLYNGRRWPLRDFDAALARAFLAYGAPVGLTMIFGGLATASTPIMLSMMSGYEAVGAFTVAFTIVQSTLGVIALGISAATYPAAIRAVEGGDASAARAILTRYYTALLALLLPAGVGLSLLAPGIARVLVAPQYHVALAAMMPWLAACAVLMGFRASYVDLAFHLGKRTGFLVQVVVVAVLVNIALGVALIPPWGYVGASVAMTCAFGVALVHASFLAGRAYPIPLPIRETCGVVLATGLMAAVIEMTPASWGPLSLLAQVAGGVGAYTAALFVLSMLAPPRVLAGTAAARLSLRLRHALSPSAHDR